jgi:pimeloyl-ACP methyl ester carboxylesterase
MDFDYVVMPVIILALGMLIIWLSVRRMRSLSTKAHPTWRKVAERFAFSIVVFLAVAVVGSSSFNAIALHRFWALNPAPGRIVEIDGHKMHIYCTGSGSPTIVLEAGAGNDSVVWRGVQPVLSKTTRVCSYDRAGSGWSDKVPGPRDADHVADQLHQLLTQVGITDPVVLMGHSIGGIYLRDYATRFPQQVEGLVLVDSATPFQDKAPGMEGGRLGPPFWVVSVAMKAGVPRLLGMCTEGAKGTEDRIRKLQAEANCRLHSGVMSAEVDSFDQSSQQTVRSGPYGALAILVISHDPSKMPTPHTQQDMNRQKAWSRMQEDLKKLSTRSRRVVAKGSMHDVMLDRPDLIENEVPLFIEQIRGTVPQPTNYGSTITE